jgi:hypothetical protein
MSTLGANSATGVACSKGAIVLDPFTGGSTDIFTSYDRGAVNNMFRGRCAVDPFSLIVLARIRYSMRLS